MAGVFAAEGPYGGTVNRPGLEELDIEECMDRLSGSGVGRIAMLDDGWPVVFPVNYRLVDHERHRWIAIRARVEGAIDHPESRVAFEIDGIDPIQHTGWSVLVRGTLHHVDERAADISARFDPGPWAPDRDAWLVIEPNQITGRRIPGPQPDWAFSVRAYL